jgi:hypothetical protein
MKWCVWLFILLQACVLKGCGNNKNSLSGSLSKKVNLAFDRIKAYQNGEFLVITYLRRYNLPQALEGMGPRIDNQVVRLTLNSKAQSLVGNQILKFRPRENIHFGVAEHYVLKSSDRIHLEQEDGLSDIASGVLFFERLELKPGGKLKGYFQISFQDGSDLTGTFSTRLTELS